MQNAVIFLVEDDNCLINPLCALLSRRGHQVVLKAMSLEESLRIVASGELQEKGVNIAIVDGSFPRANGQELDFHGPSVAEAIRGAGLPIKIIAHTAHMGRKAEYGDVYAFKGGGPDSLFEVIASL